MELNPIDKAKDLLQLLKEYYPLVKTKNDLGYDWLEEETDLCIEVLSTDNPIGKLYIVCEDGGEFTLCFDAHAHYYSCEQEYQRMCSDLRDILNNEMCSANLYSKSDGTWYGGGFFSCASIALPVREVFDFLWENPETAARLQTSGYEVKYCFWDSKQNQTVETNPSASYHVSKYDP